ncbi:DeoR family transcriptional regulator, partial [Klebsiella pneumoniae]|uniref:DeoR family transcriptional regulator n=1 Tax=Klebsiella pneumoniae TaxID=573 RepID=UPI002731A317
IKCEINNIVNGFCEPFCHSAAFNQGESAVDSKKTERFKAMHRALQGEAAVHLRDMAALLGVSEMTLRRDLVNNAQG